MLNLSYSFMSRLNDTSKCVVYTLLRPNVFVNDCPAVILQLVNLITASIWYEMFDTTGSITSLLDTSILLVLRNCSFFLHVFEIGKNEL